jgi:ribosomal protein L7/L12
MKFRQYFAPYEDYFWELLEEESTSVFVLRGGGTIIYAQLLMQILEDLASQGLPPLGALLLAVVATNHSREDQLQVIEEDMRKVITGFRPADTGVATEALDEAIDLLRTLAALPLKYTSGTQRIQLFQLLFSNSHYQISAHQCREVLLNARSCVDGQGRISGLPTSKKTTWSNFGKDFRAIGLLARRFPNAEAIIEQLTTMPSLPEALPLEETPEPRAGDLIEELIGHPLTFQVGALIKPIWSGLNIPMHHQLPGDQPLGGFSDLSNKGDFDKLLISEFANDELLLLSRVANNEALFLHREIPPGTDDLQRVVLLDVSLKSWGNPRILAYATMLAIARHPRTDIRSAVFAVGEELKPVAFGTVDEVIASLQLLEGCLHPAGGLAKFFDRQRGRAKLEIIFIAPPDTLAQPGVKKVISDHYNAFKYWIEVGGEGEIDVYKNQNNCRKLIQQMRLPLDSIWKSYKRVHPGTDNKAARIPATPPQKAQAPLLYPASPYKFCMAAEDKAFYGIDKQGKLFRLYCNKGDRLSGFELLFEGLPSGATHFQIGEAPKSGHRLLLCYTAGTGEMMQFDIETGEAAAIDLHGRNGRIMDDLFFAKGAFYFQSREDYNKIINGMAVHFDSRELVDKEKYENGLKEHRARMVEAVQILRRNKFAILRNLTTVGINQAGNLVFNKHELVCRPAGHIVLTQWSKDRESDMACHAVWDDVSGAFVFSSGNRIRVDRSGMLILEWQERQSKLSDVLMTSSGPSKLTVVKEIKERTNISLMEAKSMVDAGRAVVVSGVEFDDAVQSRDRLMNAGAVAEVIRSPQKIYIPAALDTSLGVATASEFAGNSYYFRPKEDLLIRTIEPNEFFKKNIRSFVQDILQWNSR